jgi:hypothetical protein
MTYSLAAPLLHKEVVVGDFSKFFFGLDNDILDEDVSQKQPADLEELLPPQTFICCSVKSGGLAYKCPQHSDSDSMSTSTDREEESPVPLIYTSVRTSANYSISSKIYISSTHPKTERCTQKPGRTIP